MADITPTPLYLKDVILTVDGDTYEKAVSSVTLTPAVAMATFKGLDEAAVYNESGAATWNADIVYVQDWDSIHSFSAYLFANQGSKVTMTFKPKSLSGGTFSATVLIVHGSIGGTVDAFATSTVSMPVEGQPTFTPAA